MYGAAGVEYAPEAEESIERYTRLGLGALPICMAKTQYSFRCCIFLLTAMALQCAVPCTGRHQLGLRADLLSHCCCCSTDASAKGAPSGFTVRVREVRASAGAGFIIPICGDMMMMPGLPTRPAFFDIDLDPDTGRVLGLS